MDVASSRRHAAEQMGGSTGEGPGHAEGVDLGLSGMVTGRDVFTHVVVRPFVVWLVSGVLLLPVFFFLFLIGIVAAAGGGDDDSGSTSDPFAPSSGFGSDESDDDGGAGGAVLFLSTAIWMVPPVLALGSLFIPLRVGRREFGILLDDEAPAADSPTDRSTASSCGVGRRSTP